MPLGTVATAVACSTADVGPVEVSQIFWPDGTVAPLAIGIGGRRVRPHVPPVTLTVVLAPGALEVTVNGPIDLAGRNAGVVGVMVRLGGGRFEQRPSAVDVVHDADHDRSERVGLGEHVLVSEEPDGGLHCGRFLVNGKARRSGGVGVVLVQQPGHIAHVGDVGGVPGAQLVADAGIGGGVRCRCSTGWSELGRRRVASAWMMPANGSSFPTKPTAGSVGGYPSATGSNGKSAAGTKPCTD